VEKTRTKTQKKKRKKDPPFSCNNHLGKCVKSEGFEKGGVGARSKQRQAPQPGMISQPPKCSIRGNIFGKPFKNPKTTCQLVSHKTTKIGGGPSRETLKLNLPDFLVPLKFQRKWFMLVGWVGGGQQSPLHTNTLLAENTKDRETNDRRTGGNNALWGKQDDRVLIWEKFEQKEDTCQKLEGAHRRTLHKVATTGKATAAGKRGKNGTGLKLLGK